MNQYSQSYKLPFPPFCRPSSDSQHPQRPPDVTLSNAEPNSTVEEKEAFHFQRVIAIR